MLAPGFAGTLAGDFQEFGKTGLVSFGEDAVLLQGDDRNPENDQCQHGSGKALENQR